jgi:hypothetical protein
MKYSILLLSLLLSQHLLAQDHFTRIYNVDTTGRMYHAWGNCWPAEKTADNGYLLKCVTYESFPDYWIDNSMVIKTDSLFRPEWQRTMWPPSTFALMDGSILHFGPNVGYLDTPYYSTFGLEKLDLAGNVLWTRRVVCNDDLAFACASHANSKFRLGGVYMHYDTITQPKPFFVDVDSNGTVLGADTLHITGGDIMANLFTDNSGNYYPVLKGYFGSSHFIVAKMLPDNSVAWSYALDSARIEINGIVALSNGDVIVGGNYWTHDSTIGRTKIFLLKLSSSGSILWQKTANMFSKLGGMQLLPNNNVVISAGGNSMLGDWYSVDQYVMEIDSAANIVWAKNIDLDSAAWPHYSGFSAPYMKNANEWYFTATTWNMYAVELLKTDSNVNGHCVSAPQAISFYDTAKLAISPASITLGTIPVTTVVRANGPSALQHPTYVDSCDYAVPPPITQVAIIDNDVKLFPNPASDKLHISAPTNKLAALTISDLTGKIVYTVRNATDADLRDLPPGNYIVRIDLKDGTPVYRKLNIIR